MVEGHDEVARQMITDHIKHCDDRMGRIDQGMDSIKAALDELNKRWSRINFYVVFGLSGTVGSLLIYIWNNHAVGL